MKNLYQLYFLGIVCFLSACAYPYHSPQARRARAAAKQQLQAQQAQNAALIMQQLQATVKSLDPLGKKTQSSDTNNPDAPNPLPAKGKNSKLKNPNPDPAPIVADPVAKTDSLEPTDSAQLLDVAADTSRADSPKLRPAYIQFSSDSLDADVNYSAKDSMIYDLIARKIYLYGSADVLYKDYRLQAGRIVIDMTSSVAIAEGVLDSNENETQRPSFKDASQEFGAKKIEFNFKSKKGKVYEASTKQGDGFFISEVTKFVGKGDSSAQTDDVIYAQNCLYTTCNHRYPHFGIRGSRAKVIPNKLIVLGPSYLEIMATPTPLVLPFAFFPLNQKTRKSGLIFSTNIEFSPTFGAGLRGIGYYFRFSDYVDLALRTDVYMRGTFRLYAESAYNRRYQYNGKLSVAYARLRFGEQGTPDFAVKPSFNISWTYNQDQKAHPARSFSANVNFGSSDFFRNNTNSASQVLQGTLQSQVSYTQRLSKNLTFMLGAAGSQNVATRLMNLTLPSAQIRLNNISPFKRKVGAGDKWYEQVKFAYNMSFNNQIFIYDSVLFAPDGIQRALDTMNYSIKHQPTLTFNLKLFRYINVQPQIAYNETWVFRAQNSRFDNSLYIRYDTSFADDGTINSIKPDTTFGKVLTERQRGFYQVRDMSAGLSANTQIYAFTSFAIGRLHRVRAVLRPDVGFRWRPDYQADFWNYYQELPYDSRYPDRTRFLKRYDVAPGGGKSALLTYSLSARIDGKWRKSAADTSKERYKNIILVNNISLAGNYNMAADSFKFSTVTMNANATLFKQLTLTANATFDPYAADRYTDKRLNVLQYAENGQLARFTNLNFNATTNINSAFLRGLFNPPTSKAAADPKGANNSAAGAAVEFLQSMNLNYNLNLSRKYANGRDTVVFSSHEINLNGNINFSKNWNFRIGRIGYDFQRKGITYPDFTISRQLHCWEMGTNWQPERGTYQFFLRVRPGSLGFINVPYNKNVFDPY